MSDYLVENTPQSQTLSAAEDRYRSLFEGLPIGLFRSTPAGQILDVNPALVEMLGYPNRESLMAVNAADLYVNSDDRRRWQALMEREGVVRGFEVQARRYDGTSIWLRNDTRAVRDSEGRVLCYEGSLMDITARKQVEAALQASEARHRSLIDDVLDSLAVGIFILDADFKVIWINQATERFFGLRREEVIGQDKRKLVRERIAPSLADPDGFAERVLATYENNTYVEHFECQVLPDGRREGRWLEHWSRPIRSGLYAGGRIEHYTDITKSKQKSQELLEKTFASLRDALFIIDADTVKIIDCNPAASQIFGYSRAEILGQTTAFLHVDEAALETFREKLDEAIAKQGFLYLPEFRMKRKDGTIFPTEHSVIPLEDEKGKCIGWVSVVRDITEQKQAEETLRESEERYRSLFDRVPVGLYRTTPEGQILDVNPALVQMQRYPDRESMLAVNVADFYVYPEERERWLVTLQRNGIARDFEFQQRRYDGSIIWVRSSARAVRDADGRLLYYEGVVEDVTERKQAEEKLRQYSNRLRIMRQIDQAILAAQSPTEIAQVALSRLHHLVPCQWASVVVFDPNMQNTTVLATYMDGTTRAGADPRVPPAVHTITEMLRRERISFVSDLRTLPNPSPMDQALLDKGVRAYLNVPLIVQGGEVIGALNLGSEKPGAFEGDHMEVARSVANSLAIAIQNARLFEQVRTGRERLQALSRRLVEAQETAGRRIARELHDEVGQALTGLMLTLRICARTADEDMRTNLEEAMQVVNELMVRVRELSLDLRPAMLDDLGLLPALLWHFDRFAAQTGVQVNFKHTGLEGRRFTSEVETAAYRVVQEALTNIARHASVNEATVRAWVSEDMLGIQVEDRGTGFDPETVLTAGTTGGLTGMYERVTLLGGQLIVESAPGHGTRLTAELPLRGHLERRGDARFHPVGR